MWSPPWRSIVSPLLHTFEVNTVLKLRDAVDAAHNFKNTTPGNLWLQFGCGNSSFFKNIVSTNELAPNFPPPMWKRGRHWISLFKKTHLFLIDPSDNLRTNILKSIHSYLPQLGNWIFKTPSLSCWARLLPFQLFLSRAKIASNYRRGRQQPHLKERRNELFIDKSWYTLSSTT